MVDERHINLLMVPFTIGPLRKIHKYMPVLFLNAFSDPLAKSYFTRVAATLDISLTSYERLEGILLGHPELMSRSTCKTKASENRPIVSRMTLSLPIFFYHRDRIRGASDD